MKAISWKKLNVYEAMSGDYEGTLEDIVLDEDRVWYLDSADYNDDGEIESWADHYIAAPGEEPDWSTPKIPVDWTGFIEAVQGVSI